MGVSIPHSYEHDVDITHFPTLTMGSVGPVTLAGIPDTYHYDITGIPKIRLSIDPLKLEPVDVSVRLKEIPSVRTHLPANYCVGVSLMGFEFMNVRLCGESQVITEPYRPNPCEVCGSPRVAGAADLDQRDVAVLKLRED